MPILRRPSRRPPGRRPRPFPRALLALPLALLLAGCAQLDPGAGFQPVAEAVQQRLGQPTTWIRSEADRQAADRRVQALLAQPLGADEAVQVALLNHRGLQSSLAALGVAQAELVQAGRLANPGIRLGRARRGGEIETSVGLELQVARLIAMPMALGLERQRLARAQRDAVQQVLGLAHATRRAHIQAVAAVEGARYFAQVQEVAQAGADLARRMKAAGNWSALSEAREQAFEGDAAVNLARAEHTRQSALERLARLLGLPEGPSAFSLPERLPELPDTLPEPASLLEASALAQRLDLQAARLDTEALAGQLGLVRRTRFIDVLDLGATRTGSNREPTERGYEIGFELPLFDWGDSRVARAEAIYMQAVERTAQAVVDARSEVREAEAARRARFQVARRYRDEILPLRRRIADEQQLRYNGMLSSVFELMADARAQIDAVRDSLEATREFWLAQADLDQALIGPAPAP
jgi:outer membrane protein TolC